MRRALLLVLPLLVAIGLPAAAQERSITIRGFDTELLVQPSGQVEVTEIIRFAFTGAWNGINRDISLQHHTAQGDRRKLDLEVIGVTDDRGEPLRVERESGGDGWIRRLKIWIPGAQDAERTVVIRYRVNNAIRFYFASDTAPGFDELYWNATGNDWTMPIDRASARIVLPEGVRATRTAVYTGYEGATGQDAEIGTADGGRIVSFTTTREFSTGEGLTVAAGWPPGAIASRPTPEEYRRAQAMRLWPLGLPILAFLLAFRAWRRRGRDPKPQSIAVQYEPPDGMGPAELGTLVDHKAEMRDVTAILVDLAVRGYVGIEEREEKRFLGLLSSTEYVFHLRRPREEWGELPDHDRRFLSGLFSGATSADAPWDEIRATFVEAWRAREAGAETDRDAASERPVRARTAETSSVKLSELQNKFYTSLPGIRDAIYDSLVRRGHYLQRPDKVKATWVAVAIAVFVLGMGATAFTADAAAGWMAPGALAAGTIVSALVLLVFGMVMPARTPAGARAREAALGFREFLARVDTDRYRRMITSPEMFERYLPHAMAFGVEARWAKAFDDLYREPPDWYSGSGYTGFRASSFTARMSTLSSSAGSTMSSSPSSSGSGGGGSSGGGSGGGGGSGF